MVINLSAYATEIIRAGIAATPKGQTEAAAADFKNLAERPDNSTMLKLYALFKQGSIGDNTDKKPGCTRWHRFQPT